MLLVRMILAISVALLACLSAPVLANPTIATTDVRLTTTVGTAQAQGSSVAYSSDNNSYLLSYVSGGVLYVQVLDSALVPVGNATLVSAGVAEGRLAYHPYSREFIIGYVVVGTENEVWARRLSASGAPMGAAVQVSDQPAGSGQLDSVVRLAVNATYGRVFFVWQSNTVFFSKEIKGRLYNYDLTPFHPQVIYRFVYPGVNNGMPDVISNDTTNDFFIVHADTAHNVRGQRVDGESGTAEGSSFVIKQRNGVDRAYVAWNASTNEYLVVYTGNVAAGESEVYGRRVSAAGVVLGDDDIRISHAGPDGNINYSALVQGVAYDTTNHDYLVHWSGDSLTDGMVFNEIEIFGQLVASDGTLPDSNFRISYQPMEGDALFTAIDSFAVFDATNSQFLVAWTGTSTVDYHDIYAKAIVVVPRVVCGDGVVAGLEECDDGNTDSADCCSPGCEEDPDEDPCGTDACKVGQQCTLGVCGGGTDKDCADGAICTDDSCHLGDCSHLPNNLLCSDGNDCTDSDICAGGTCSGSPALCDDSNPCTQDICGGPGICFFVANSMLCDDGNDCTDSDTCTGGACSGSPALCDDSNPCTQDICGGPGICFFVPNSMLCDDGNDCTDSDTCTGGDCSGSPALCDDSNPCTQDICGGPGICFFVPNGIPCDDGNACTTGDACGSGACAGALIVCDDSNLCTDDSCGGAGTCQFVPNSVGCSDGSACTVGDVCGLGVCVPGSALLCQDDNPCTSDGCDLASGCTVTNTTDACSDDNVCTTGDLCGGGICLPGATTDCSDGNVCTTDECNPVLGCSATNNVQACNDGNACTSGDACGSGACAGLLIVCDDNNLCTDDSCDGAGICQFVPNSVGCSDGSACTVGDVCGLGVCVPGSALPCEDGNLCTTDGCDAASGCTAINVASPCSDGNACSVGDICAGGACVAGSATLACGDNNPCTDNACVAAKGCVSWSNVAPCDDGNVCTTLDRCVAGICLGSGTCVDAGDGEDAADTDDAAVGDDTVSGEDSGWGRHCG
jgi:cysteine-rich repeat protein